MKAAFCCGALASHPPAPPAPPPAPPQRTYLHRQRPPRAPTCTASSPPSAQDTSDSLRERKRSTSGAQLLVGVVLVLLALREGKEEPVEVRGGRARSHVSHDNITMQCLAHAHKGLPTYMRKRAACTHVCHSVVSGQHSSR